MSGARWRVLGLLLALVAVAAALWVLSGSGGSRRSGSTQQGTPRSDGVDASPDEPRGIAPREVTVAGVGTVKGQVVDEDGQAVVEGQLTLWCLRPDGEVGRIRDGVVTVDEEGRFEGPACRGEVCAELRHPSRVPADEWVLRRGEPALLQTRMLPRLWGRVVDPSGQPVEAAQITVMLAPDDDDPTSVLPVTTPRTSTDADGLFSLARIDRPPCTPCQRARGSCHEGELLPVVERVLVTARAPGWAPGELEVDVEESADADAPVVLTLRAAVEAITGTLVDTAGEALPRAVVLARSELRPHEQHRVETSDGVFVFEALADGPYGLRAIQDGIELLRRDGVEPGETVELRLPHAQREVVLRVLDEAGRPIAGAEVQGGPFGRSSADGEGRVRVERAAPGAYILRIRIPGAKARAVDLEVPPVPDDQVPPEISLTLSRGPSDDAR